MRNLFEDSALVQQIVAEHLHDAVEITLRARFKKVPRWLKDSIRRVMDVRALKNLVAEAATCADFGVFMHALVEIAPRNQRLIRSVSK